eukprot:gene12018-25180_t
MSDIKGCEYISGRLYYVPLTTSPSSILMQRHHFFSIDQELVYWNFFYDFGPLNLGHLYRFCVMLNGKLADIKLKDKIIYFYSGSHAHKKANASFLISAWAMLYLDRTPEEAFRPVRGLGLPLWHDATNTVCTFQLTVLDTLKGLEKARQCKFFNFQSFDIDEYEHFEQVENGDLNWCMDGKFIAFAGPHASKDALDGYRALTPDDYIPYFKRKNVTLVVRLNKKYYDAKRFVAQGIDHMELYYLDGSVPTFDILNRFLVRCEETPGAVAVHCKAGLGRTGTCIGAYMMKHFRFTAEEVIGWLRIVRPGSIIGPQQQFMREIQSRIWREGDLYRERLHAGQIPSLLSLPRDEDKSVATETDTTPDSPLPTTLFSGIAALSVSKGGVPSRPVATPPSHHSHNNNNNNHSTIAGGGSGSGSLPQISLSGTKGGVITNGLAASTSDSKASRERLSSLGLDLKTTSSSPMPQLQINTSNSTSPYGAKGEPKEQGDYLRMRRQQILNEQQQTASSKAGSVSSPLASAGAGTGSTSSTPTTPVGRSPGFTTRFLSSWRK